MERCLTGLKRLDDILNGGLPKNNFIAVAGPSGSGKTNFGIEFIHNGAVHFKEPAVFLTVDQSKEEIIATSRQIGMDLEPLVESGMLSIIPASYYDLDRLFFLLEAEVLKKPPSNTTRVFLDSIEFNPKDSDQMPFFKKLLKSLNCTTLFTVETYNGQLARLSFADGVIELDSSSSQRNIRVGKMRGTSHDLARHSMEITGNGILIGDKWGVIRERVVVEAQET